MKYVFPITPNYVANWDTWSAIRELLQNAMDARDAGGECPELHYCNDRKELTITSPKERLSRRSLLLGETGKGDQKNQRGEFGEGYKLALVVLCRQGMDVEIQTGGERWTPNFAPSEDFDGANVLHIRIEPHEPAFDGIRFTINNVEPESWELVCKRFIPEVPNDTILKSPGDIYCGGIYVTHIQTLLRGYNFAPHRLTMNRDRSVVADFDIKLQTAWLWRDRAEQHPLELSSLLKVDAPDVEHIDFVPAKPAEVIVKDFEKTYGEGTVPVDSQKELDQVRQAGYRAQIVPSPLKRIVRGVKSYVFHEQRTPGGRMKKFWEKYRDRLDIDIREELEILVNESAMWR